MPKRVTTRRSASENIFRRTKVHGEHLRAHKIFRRTKLFSYSSFVFDDIFVPQKDLWPFLYSISSLRRAPALQKITLDECDSHSKRPG